MMETASKRSIAHKVRRPRTILLLAVGWFLLLNLLCLALWTAPAYLDGRQTETDLLRKTQELDRLKSQPDPVNATEQQIRQLDGAVPPRLELAEVIAALDQYASETGVSLTNLKQTDDSAAGANQTPAGMFRKTPFEMTVTGKLPALLNFFGNINSSERALILDEWNIAQGDPGTHGNPAILTQSVPTPAKKDIYQLHIKLTFFTREAALLGENSPAS